MERFLSADAPKSLGELIFQKIQEAEANKTASGDTATETITPKIVDVFTKVSNQHSTGHVLEWSLFMTFVRISSYVRCVMHSL